MPSKNEAQSTELGTWGEAPASDAAPATTPRDDSGIDDTRAFLKGLIESILFVTDHPLGIKELARAAKLDRRRAEELVEELRRENEHRGVRVEEVAGGFVLRSNPTYAQYVREFLAQRPVRLTRAQLETLAIIAYRQPITRPEIDDIRGVDSGPVLKGLLERDLDPHSRQEGRSRAARCSTARPRCSSSSSACTRSETFRPSRSSPSSATIPDRPSSERRARKHRKARSRKKPSRVRTARETRCAERGRRRRDGTRRRPSFGRRRLGRRRRGRRRRGRRRLGRRRRTRTTRRRRRLGRRRLGRRRRRRRGR